MSLDDFQRLTMAQSDLPNIVRLTRGIASSEVTVFKKNWAIGEILTVRLNYALCETVHCYIV